MGKRILIVDDEKEIIELLTLYLEKDGYEVVEAYDGIMALDALKAEKVDLAVIDIMMPNMDGYSLIKHLRKEFKKPIIFISAKNDASDKILGLELGSDDYIQKPFNPLEVVARIKAQLRRYYEFNEIVEEKETIEIDDLKLDTKSCTCYKLNEPLILTSTEYKIIEFLMSNPNKVFTKKQIFEKVWDDIYYGDDNTIMVHMSKVRDKIEDNSKNPVHLKTIRGLGYKFEGGKK